ncbi:hypothetical protein [Brockia lithotrophica]|uniref:Uncharacterized protein n=1 Tax=Brockia lithotrophica TaxID=933949 RepID=A0A660L7L9_9BACL|nr:hypothetical protein [Brockia lithotrophica]RKQ88832.1 hypothetical protein C7438_0476 [Brockia lithotrophica]
METSLDRYTEAVRVLARTYADPDRAEMLLRYVDEHLRRADWPDGFPEFLAGLEGLPEGENLRTFLLFDERFYRMVKGVEVPALRDLGATGEGVVFLRNLKEDYVPRLLRAESRYESYFLGKPYGLSRTEISLNARTLDGATLSRILDHVFPQEYAVELRVAYRYAEPAAHVRWRTIYDNPLALAVAEGGIAGFSGDVFLWVREAFGPYLEGRAREALDSEEASLDLELKFTNVTLRIFGVRCPEARAALENLDCLAQCALNRIHHVVYTPDRDPIPYVPTECFAVRRLCTEYLEITFASA